LKNQTGLQTKHQRSLGLFENDLIALERAMHVLGTLVAKPRHFLLVTQSFFWKIISKTGISLYTDIKRKEYMILTNDYEKKYGDGEMVCSKSITRKSLYKSRFCSIYLKSLNANTDPSFIYFLLKSGLSVNSQRATWPKE